MDNNFEPIDPFSEFADYYDLMPRDDAGLRDFFEYLINRHNIRSVLDCACGTGNDLLLLHELGIEVSGSDISRAMLKCARAKIDTAKINLIQCDFRKLPETIKRRFDMVLSLDTSIPQLSDKKDVLDALKSMRGALNPEGILVLSQGMTDAQYKARKRFHPVVITSKFSRVMVIDYLEKYWQVHVLDIRHLENEPSFNIFAFKYLTLLRDDYKSLLTSAGFESITFYNGFTSDPGDEFSSGTMVIVAENGPGAI